MQPRSYVRGRGVASPPDEVGEAIDELIEHLAAEAGIETHEAHEAIREGRVVETIKDRCQREMRQLLLIAVIGFLVQALVMGLFYWLAHRG